MENRPFLVLIMCQPLYKLAQSPKKWTVASVHKKTRSGLLMALQINAPLSLMNIFPICYLTLGLFIHKFGHLL